jgi:hypothetical protein
MNPSVASSLASFGIAGVLTNLLLIGVSFMLGEPRAQAAHPAQTSPLHRRDRIRARGKLGLAHRLLGAGAFLAWPLFGLVFMHLFLIFS